MDKNQPLITKEGMEFAAQIAELPSDLQKNPAVLYYKAATFYATVKWTDVDNTAHAELKTSRFI